MTMPRQQRPILGQQAFLPGMSAQGRTTDPFIAGDPRLARQMAFADALAARGADTSPVGHPLEAGIRLATAGLAGYQGRQAEEGARTAKEMYRKALAEALAGMKDATGPDGKPVSKVERLRMGFESMARATGDNPALPNPFEAPYMAAISKDPEVKFETVFDPATGRNKKVLVNMQDASTKDVGGVEAPNFGPGFVQKEQGKVEIAPEFVAGKAKLESETERAKNPVLIARAGGEAAARATVDQRTAGGIAEARAAGTIAGELKPVAGADGAQMPGVQAVAAAKDAHKSGDARQGAERKWRDEFKPLLNQAADLVSQRNIIKTAVSKGDGTGDIAAITAFNKMLDPGAVVREADVALTLSAQSVVDRMGVWLQNKKEGEILPPELRRKMGELADQIYATSANTIKQRVMPYKPVIEKDGYSFGNIVPEALQKEMGWAEAAPAQATGAPGATAAPDVKQRKIVVQNGMRFDQDTGEFLGQVTP